MLAESPDNPWLWDVTIEAFRVVEAPYEAVVPYSTWVLEPSLVLQEMVAPETVTLVAVTEEITGGIVWARRIYGYGAIGASKRDTDAVGIGRR